VSGSLAGSRQPVAASRFQEGHLVSTANESLRGKVALVTGGSRGIGLAIARALGACGADVALTATTQSGAARAAATLAADGRRFLGLTVDVRTEAQVQSAMAQVEAQLGGLDILVNNAGVGLFAPVADMSPEDWHRVIDTNLTGVYYCCRAAIPLLRKRGGGWIINISSLAGKNTFVRGGAYCASKFALNALSEVLMEELRHDGIRVSYVMPGSVATEFSGRAPGPGEDWKLGPEDIAEVVTDLLAHPGRSLPSRVEIRPSRPPRKG
jgi:NAD(P)-dependent dehydrogenase (short-subunit alcohol dehydrogenase family)